MLIHSMPISYEVNRFTWFWLKFAWSVSILIKQLPHFVLLHHHHSSLTIFSVLATWILALHAMLSSQRQSIILRSGRLLWTSWRKKSRFALRKEIMIIIHIKISSHCTGHLFVRVEYTNQKRCMAWLIKIKH